MKKFFIPILMLTGIMQTTYAQITNMFEIPAGHFSRLFRFSLNKGNKIQIELTAIEDLPYIQNFDSIIRKFAESLGPIADSIPEDIFSRRVDYIADTSGIKKFSITNTAPSSSAYVVENGVAALLKIAQDTIIIAGVIPLNYYTDAHKKKALHYYRISFFLNDLNDLQLYMNGQLDSKFKMLRENINTTWAVGKDGRLHLQKSPDISALQARGHIGSSNVFALAFSVDAANYKNYFEPSLSAELEITRNNGLIKNILGFGWEEHFIFSAAGTEKVRTFKNGFVSFSYNRKINSSDKIPWEFSSFTISYLLARNGDIYDKNTFRLGAGKVVAFGGRTEIQPAIYFNKLFKGVTPSLKIIQRF